MLYNVFFVTDPRTTVFYAGSASALVAAGSAGSAAAAGGSCAAAPAVVSLSFLPSDCRAAGPNRFPCPRHLETDRHRRVTRALCAQLRDHELQVELDLCALETPELIGAQPKRWRIGSIRQRLIISLIAHQRDLCALERPELIGAQPKRWRIGSIRQRLIISLIAHQRDLCALERPELIGCAAWSKPPIRDTSCCCHPLTSVP